MEENKAENEEQKPAETQQPDQGGVAGNENAASPAPGGEVEANSLEGSDADAEPEKAAEAPKMTLKQRIKGITGHLNIYLLSFMLILLVAGILAFLSMQANNKKNESSTKQETLTADQLKDLQNSATKIGDPKSTLNVESNAIFSGGVLVRGSLDVAGTIKVGGALSLPGITVSGTSSFDQVNINNLAISGSTSIQGQLSVQKGLTVSGPANFSSPISAPQLNIDTLQISKDLIIGRHIDTSGSTPNITFGGALGTGGTASVNGTDTSGTITINTGSSPAAFSCFATLTFTQKFNSIPHVVVTPVGSSAANLNFYITRTSTQFAVCTGSVAAPASSNFSFDYMAME